jgi:hypothetical protein
MTAADSAPARPNVLPAPPRRGNGAARARHPLVAAGELLERFGHLLDLKESAFRASRPAGPGGGSTHAAQMLDRSGFFDA